jgi:sporulation protein YlmC with PRC-barrel domain
MSNELMNMGGRAMDHLGTLRDFAFDRDADDIRGTRVYGSNDEKLGKVDDVIFDHQTAEIRYAVVDTGGWLSSKKFLIPADRIHGYGQDDDAFQVDMSKERIEQFPRYDEKSLHSENDWKDYENEYKRSWDTDPVQHRDDRVDLDVTPATIPADVTATGVPRGSRAEIGSDIPRGSLGEDMTDEYAASDEERARIDDERLQRESIGEDVTPHRLAGKFPETVQTPDKIQMTPAHAPERDYPSDANDNPTASGGRRIEEGREPVPVDPRIEQREVRSTGEEVREDVNRSEVHRAGVGEWHPRMRRFEDVLRRNRVDVTASCAACAPKKDKAA